MSARETAARKDLADDESHGAWASGQHGETTRNSLGLLGSKGARTRVGGRRGESGAGAGAATAARRWCWRPSSSAGTSETGVLRRTRGGARARRLPAGVGLAATGRRSGGHGGARLDAKGGGEHGARGRFTQAREGSRRVVGRVRGDQGRGVLLPPLPTMRHKVPGHGEAAAARFGQARRRHPTRGGRAKAQPGLPGIDTRALGCAVTRALGRRYGACECKHERERVRLGAASRARRQAPRGRHDDTRQLG
jgi:hypothetical protein